jgi:hypothetical protein
VAQGRKTEARQDDYARSQLDGHLTAADAIAARKAAAAQAAAASHPDAPRADGSDTRWQPMSAKDFAARAAGYGLTPEEAAQAYSERPVEMTREPQMSNGRMTAMGRVSQAQASRAQEEWLKTKPGIHRHQARQDQQKYGDGTPADQITPEQYSARVERRNQERAARDPAYGRQRQIERLAQASGKTPEEVEAEMFPQGAPQPSDKFKERQAAREAQKTGAQEQIWERRGSSAHLDAKTRSPDAAVVREGLSRLARITGDPNGVYEGRLAAMDEADAATAKTKADAEAATVANAQAQTMQQGDIEGKVKIEGKVQEGQAAERKDVAAENELARKNTNQKEALDRGHELTKMEQAQKNTLEEKEATSKLSVAEAKQLLELQKQDAAFKARLAEKAAAADHTREQTTIENKGKADEGVERAKRPDPIASSADTEVDRIFADPTATFSTGERQLAAKLRADSGGTMSEDAANQMASSTMRNRALTHASGNLGSMKPAVRTHLTQTIENAGGDPPVPMTREDFRAYAADTGNLAPEQADAVYDSITDPPTAGRADLAEPPAGNAPWPFGPWAPDVKPAGARAHPYARPTRSPVTPE